MSTKKPFNKEIYIRIIAKESISRCGYKSIPKESYEHILTICDNKYNENMYVKKDVLLEKTLPAVKDALEDAKNSEESKVNDLRSTVAALVNGRLDKQTWSQKKSDDLDFCLSRIIVKDSKILKTDILANLVYDMFMGMHEESDKKI